MDKDNPVAIESPQLRELMRRIQEFDPAVFQPNVPVGEEDVDLGECPESARKIYSYAQFCRREAKQVQLEREFATPDEDESAKAHASVDEMNQTFQVCMQMFWFCVQDDLRLWGHQHLGVRQGWRVVTGPCEHGLPAQVRQFLGLQF